MDAALYSLLRAMSSTPKSHTIILGSTTECCSSAQRGRYPPHREHWPTGGRRVTAGTVFSESNTEHTHVVSWCPLLQAQLLTTVKSTETYQNMSH